MTPVFLLRRNVANWKRAVGGRLAVWQPTNNTNNEGTKWITVLLIEGSRSDLLDQSQAII